jgi:hypothetical protein
VSVDVRDRRVHSILTVLNPDKLAWVRRDDEAVRAAAAVRAGEAQAASE